MSLETVARRQRPSQMATQATLLDAILNAPDDDPPRLAFADLIEKNGDPDRAEFIRLQCRLSVLPADSEERATLQEREQQLLQQYGWIWAEEFGPKYKIREWAFRRGFVECVKMWLETSAEEILAILRKTPIRYLRDTSQLSDLTGVVNVLPHFDGLHGLEFWGLYGCEDSKVAEMLASPHLRNLRTLVFHHDRNGKLVDDAVLIEAMGSPYRSNLEELAVNVNQGWQGPSRALLQAMAASPYLRKLRKLNLSAAGDVGNAREMDLETVRLLGKSENFAGLEELDLGATSFPIEIWDEVLKWPWLSRLKWLRLQYARQVQAPDFIDTVATLKDLPFYRNAFEAQVAVVDWDSEFVAPWEGNTSWRGLTWENQP